MSQSLEPHGVEVVFKNDERRENEGERRENEGERRENEGERRENEGERRVCILFSRFLCILTFMSPVKYPKITQGTYTWKRKKTSRLSVKVTI